MGIARNLSAAVACVVLAAACSAATEGAESDSAEVNAARECNPLPIKTSKNVGDVDGLTATGDAPLPALGPTADEFFHPAAGYTEGGTFTTPKADPRWDVPAKDIAAPAPPGKLRVAEWNVERGNKLDKAIKLMKKLNADVWLVNESDLYGRNSGGVVVAREIARALGYSYYTGIEFYERLDDRRGTSGNAILSRYPLLATRSIDIPMLEDRGGHDWSKDQSEPRCGQRNALSALIEAKTADGGTQPVRLVALHTENKANAKVRLAQYDHVIGELVKPGEPTVVAGDLNTISPGEGPAFRKELLARTQKNGRARSLFDCSRDSEETTFSAALIINFRIDWMLVQSGTGDVLDCPAGSYDVKGNDGASDHKPVITEMTIK